MKKEALKKDAKFLSVLWTNLLNLVNKKASLFAEMALRLEKAFHLNMDTLLQMQSWYANTEMRKQTGKLKIAPYVPV